MIENPKDATKKINKLKLHDIKLIYGNLLHFSTLITVRGIKKIPFPMNQKE